MSLDGSPVSATSVIFSASTATYRYPDSDKFDGMLDKFSALTWLTAVRRFLWVSNVAEAFHTVVAISFLGTSAARYQCCPPSSMTKFIISNDSKSKVGSRSGPTQSSVVAAQLQSVNPMAMEIDNLRLQLEVNALRSQLKGKGKLAPLNAAE
ncbi:hypothetical protein BGZ99_001458 [Dissophora globulifera]|uniref:Uncharacterized protein n=1 Tax=Dissophora globulifera TaxID=979702 RepID=A0A9P6QZT5_9FUNG|nr:hypothetical protein BGZ99_001458 [Dissophora globulifera]